MAFSEVRIILWNELVSIWCSKLCRKIVSGTELRTYLNQFPTTETSAITFLTKKLSASTGTCFNDEKLITLPFLDSL